MIRFSLKRISTVGPKSSLVRWGGVRLSQTRPIPRSPSGDKNARLVERVIPFSVNTLRDIPCFRNFYARNKCLFRFRIFSVYLLSNFKFVLFVQSREADWRMMEEEEASQPLVPNRCFHHTRVGSLAILSVVRNLTPVPMPLPIFC